MNAKEGQVCFVDIPSQYAEHREELRRLFERVLDSGQFVGGPVLEGFEQALASHLGVGYAIGCSDGTMALVIALLASGIRRGDRAVVPANSYIATANAVVHAGGIPVFVDCDARTYLMDLEKLEAALKSGGVRFVLPVHLYGSPCAMSCIMAMASRYGVTVIEDNAQALGAVIDGKRTGSFGAAAGVSFYPAKNLGAFGQGGAIVTNDPGIAERARIYREQGQGQTRYYHEVVGYNARLDSLQAGWLEILLARLESLNERRRAVAVLYRNSLPEARLQQILPGATPVYHLLELECADLEQRSLVAEKLKKARCDFGYHYPVPIHKQVAYATYNHERHENAERLATTLISLPMHPGLLPHEVQRVCDAVREAGI